MKKTILYGLMFILLVSLVSADYIFQQRESANLKVPCVNNNTLCSSAATCNITIFSPDGSAIVDNQVMTNSLSHFNYTISPTETEVTGEYPFDVFCIDGGYKGHSSLNYEITSSGKGVQINYLFFIFIFISWVILAIGFSFKDYPIIAIGSIFLMVMGVYILTYGVSGFSDLTTQAFGILNLAIGGYVFMRITWEQYQEF